MSNMLSGLSSLAYQGTNAANPPNLIYQKSNPTEYDSQNVALGDIWINTSSQEVWLLVALFQNIATWVELGVEPSEVETLTGNTGGAVGPSGSNNINVVGDGTTLTVQGTAATNTLTVSLVGGGTILTLEGNTGGLVSSNSSGNFFVVGDGTTIDIVGNPSTHTLTASVINSLNITLTGNSGGAVSASAGNFNIVGDGTTIDIVGNPSTHTLTASIVSGGAIDSLTGNTGGAVHPDGSGNINILGTAGIITVTGNPSAHTLTVSAGSELATTYDADSGSAVPSSGVLIMAGGTNINTSASGNTVTINLDSTISGLTNLTVNNLTVNDSATFGFMGAGVVQSNSSGQLTSTEGTDGQILIGSSAGAPAWSTITAGANITITNGHNSITIAGSGASTGSGLVLLGSVNVAGLTSATFTTGISSTYLSYMLVADSLVLPALGSASPITIQMSPDGGVTWPLYNPYASYVAGVTYTAYNSPTVMSFNLVNGYYIAAYVFASASQQTVAFTQYLYDTYGGVEKLNTGQYSLFNPSTLYQGQSAGAFIYGSSVINMNAIQVVGPATFISGTVELYGLTN